MKIYFSYFCFSLLFISFLYSQNFQFEWELQMNAGVYLGDMDNDGVGEFLNQVNPFTIHSGIDGSIKYTANANIHPYYKPILPDFNTEHFGFDFNGNSVNDYYHLDSDSTLRISDPSTNEIIFEYNVLGGYNVLVRWIGDFDNDGIVEIGIDDYGKLVVYSTGVSISSIADGNKYLPKNFSLYQNYPNPFNPSTTIEYEINVFASVELKIYDSLGALVKTLVNQKQDRGKYNVNWDGKDERGILLSTGVYFYELKLDNSMITKKMILLK